MMKNLLKNKKHIGVFSPENELISDFLFGLGYDLFNYKSSKAKEDALYAIKRLLELDIIYIYSWMGRNSKMNNIDMDPQETVNYLDKIWLKEETDYIDMVMFGFKDWYVNSLKTLGMSATTNWEWFVENKIGNLEKWIEENKPKE